MCRRAQEGDGKLDTLYKYARDLTAEARNGKLDPVIGATIRGHNGPDRVVRM